MREPELLVDAWRQVCIPYSLDTCFQYARSSLRVQVSFPNPGSAEQGQGFREKKTVE